MDPLIKKMIEAYYPGEPAEELAWNEPDMRAVLKVVLEDQREWIDRLDPPPRSYEGANFLTRLDAYTKERSGE
jgi:hypothetical protein